MSDGWSGYPNGRIPLTMLTQIAPGVYLQPDAARRVVSMMAPFLKATGLPLKSIEGYRDFATQVYYRNLYLTGKGNVAAVPGTSKHGEALADDFAWPMTSWTTPGQTWFRAHEAQYSQSSSQGVADGEPWHKVDVGSHTTTAGGGATPLPPVTPTKDRRSLEMIQARVAGGTIADLGEFSVRAYTSTSQSFDYGTSAALWGTVTLTPDQMNTAIRQTTDRRNALVGDIAAAVIAKLPPATGGGSAGPSAAEIAAEVAKLLTPVIAAVPAATVAAEGKALSNG